MGVPRVRTDLVNADVQGQGAYPVTNHTDDRVMDANAAADAELADVLGSVIADLIAQGILKGTVSV